MNSITFPLNSATLEGEKPEPKPRYIQNPKAYLLLSNGEALEVEALLPIEDTEKIALGLREGFVYSDPEARQRRQLELALAVDLEGLTEKRCQTLLGIVNHLLYCAGACYGAVHRNEGGLIAVAREKLLALAAESSVLLRCALSGTVAYLERWWPDASRNINTVRGAINQLQDLGLLAHYSQRAAGKRSRLYTHLDIPGLLLLAEALERQIGYERLPEHGAALLQKLYDALFSGWGYRRQGEPDTQEPIDYEESVAIRQERRFQWRLGFDAAKRAALSTYQHFRALFGPSDPLTQDALGDGRNRYGPTFGTS